MEKENRAILTVPRVVWTDGKFLMFNTGISDEKDADPLIFHQFLRLNADDPDQIASFAGRCGVLGICDQHGMPVGHPRPHRMSADERCWPKTVKRKGEDWFAEPLSAWQRISEKSAALIRVARKIEERNPGEMEEWGTIRGHLDLTNPIWLNLNTAKHFLAHEIQNWLEIGGVRPRFDWDYQRGNWMLRHDIPSETWNLFGWLALRLAIEITGGRFAVCSNCGREHHVARLPSAGKPSYCTSQECRRALWRNNKRKNASPA
jgi:hypothetical protein